jgi:hypothetical protein
MRMTEEEFMSLVTRALSALIDGGSDAARTVLRNYLDEDLAHLAHYCEVLALLCEDVRSE